MPPREADPIIGLSCLKEFDSYGFYTGSVVSVEGAMYTIRWTDGELEVVTKKKVIELLFPQAPCVFSSVKLDGDSTRVVPDHFIRNRGDLMVWGRLENLGWRLIPKKTPKKKKCTAVRIEPPGGLARAHDRLSEEFDTVEAAMGFMRTTADWRNNDDNAAASNDADDTPDTCAHDDEGASSITLEHTEQTESVRIHNFTDIKLKEK